MNSLDTNLIIRFLVNDDKKQAAIVKSLFLKAEKDSESLFICNPVLLEVIYVLDSVYEYTRNEILNSLELLFMMRILEFENPDILQNFIIYGRKTKIELEDLFIGIIAKENGCETTLTFDKKAAKSNLFKLLD